MRIYHVNNAERLQGFKDLSLARRDGWAERLFRVWPVGEACWEQFNRMETTTQRVKAICQCAARLEDEEFFELDSSAWPQIYFAAVGLRSAESEHQEIMRARQIGLDLIVENLPGEQPANLENN